MKSMIGLILFVLLTLIYFAWSLALVGRMRALYFITAVAIVIGVMIPVTIMADFFGWSFKSWSELRSGVLVIITVSSTEELLRSLAVCKFNKGQDVKSREKFILLMALLYGLSENIAFHFETYLKVIQFVHFIYQEANPTKSSLFDKIPPVFSNYYIIFVYSLNLFLKVAIHFWLMKVCVYAFAEKKLRAFVVGASIHSVSNLIFFALQVIRFNSSTEVEPLLVMSLGTLNFCWAILILMIYFKVTFSRPPSTDRLFATGVEVDRK